MASKQTDVANLSDPTARAIDALDLQNPVGSDLAEFRVYDRSVIESTLSVEDWIASTGLSLEDMTVVVNVFRPIADKSELINRAFLVRSVRFSQGNFGPFTILFAQMVDTGELVLITDGSTGIHAQMLQFVNDRIAQGHPTPAEAFYFPIGLRVSEYGIDATGKPVAKGEPFVSRAQTFYLA